MAVQFPPHPTNFWLFWQNQENLCWWKNNYFALMGIGQNIISKSGRSRALKNLSIRVPTVLEKSLNLGFSLKNPWKWICPWKVLEFRGPSLKFQLVVLDFLFWVFELKVWMDTANYGVQEPIFIRPSSDGTYYGMVMSIRPGLRPTLRPSDSPSVRLSVRPSGSPSARFPHFSHTCFDILSWNFSHRSVLMYYRPSSSVIALRQFLKELCLFWNLEYK